MHDITDVMLGRQRTDTGRKLTLQRCKSLRATLGQNADQTDDSICLSSV